MKKGFTFIEALVSIVIMAVIVTGIFAVLRVVSASWDIDMGLLELQQQARQAMDGMTREIRQAKQQTGRLITITNAGKKLTFYIPGYTSSVNYDLVGNRIIREHPPNTTKVLANNVNDLSFCCWAIGGASCGTDCTGLHFLKIQMSVSKTVRSRMLSYSLLEEVRLRNE